MLSTAAKSSFPPSCWNTFQPLYFYITPFCSISCLYNSLSRIMCGCETWTHTIHQILYWIIYWHRHLPHLGRNFRQLQVLWAIFISCILILKFAHSDSGLCFFFSLSYVWVKIRRTTDGPDEKTTRMLPLSSTIQRARNLTTTNFDTRCHLSR